MFRHAPQRAGEGEADKARFLGEHRVFAKGARPVGFVGDLRHRAGLGVDQTGETGQRLLGLGLHAGFARLAALQKPREAWPIGQFAVAPAAMLGVVALVHELADFRALIVGQLALCPLPSFRPAGRAVDDRRKVADRLLEDRQEMLGRIKAAQLDDLGAIGPENHCRRPAPTLVALRQVGPAVLVDLDRNEVPGDQLLHFRIGVGLLLHDVAPGAPPGLQAEQHEALLPLGLLEHLVVPLAPRHAVGACRRRERPEHHKCADQARQPHHRLPFASACMVSRRLRPADHKRLTAMPRVAGRGRAGRVRKPPGWWLAG